jgi:SAM-dependent methyltransferase
VIPEFERIYERNWWNGTETRSGPGSTLWATELVAPAVAELVGRLRPAVRRVLDAGCGEGFWVPELPGYVGVDGSPSALKAARDAHPDRAYLLGDLRTGMPVLPRADLVLTRDAMQHLPLGDCARCLATFRDTGARWLLASTYLEGANVDVAIGDTYCPDLSAEPFSLGPPLETIPDGRTGDREQPPPATKVLGLWEL